MHEKHARLIAAMIGYETGNPHRVQHLLKVHGFAAAIGLLEGLDEETQFILETAAIVHDIGIRPAEEKYHSHAGPLQEREGAPAAERMLRSLGEYTPSQIRRVAYLVGHHHTYTDIDGMDYQILVEADFLVNLYEHQDTADAIREADHAIFRTATGKRFLHAMFPAMPGEDTRRET